MAEESDIRILAWPEKPLPMQHGFNKDEPCPVALRFEPEPVNVRVQTAPEKPLAVDMNMALSAREPVPLCVSICEPICAQSDYTIALDIFDQPVARVLVRGLTRIFNCRDVPEEPQPVTERCVDFAKRKEGETFNDHVEIGGVGFGPVEGELKIIRWGAPANTNKLLFTAAGVRILLPAACDKAAVTLINHFGQSLDIAVLRDGVEVARRVEPVDATPRRVDIVQAGVTEIVVSGGGNEAAVVEVCWSPRRVVA